MAEQRDELIEKKWTATQWKIAAGTMGTTALVDLLSNFAPSHLGAGGLVVGAILSVVAAEQGEKMASAARSSLPDFLIEKIKGLVDPSEKGRSARAQLNDASAPTEFLSNVSFDFDDEDDDADISLPSRQKKDVFRFSELLASGFVPSIRKIFIGRTMENKDIFISVEDLCHVALAGKTGGGKGSLMRLIMVQLCYIGAKVLLLNPHYMRWVRAKDGPDFDEDWTPFEGNHPRTGKPYLQESPLDCADFPPIGARLEWAVQTLLQQRKVEGREGGVRFKPYFIVVDEWPAVVAELKDAPAQLAKLLREGRKYGIFVIVASQDFQVKTIGMDGGSVRKCLLTVFYTGGDTTTAKELLNYEQVKNVPENTVGKGIVVLRSVGTQNQPTVVRVPFVDNASVYKLLGPSTYKSASQRKPVSPIVPSQAVELPLPQENQNATYTLDDVMAIINQLPDVDPEDRRYTGDMQTVVRSPYYEQSGPLRIDQESTRVQPAMPQQTVQHMSPAKTTLEQRAAGKVGEALKLWNAGHNSVRKLQAASGWSDGFTRAVIRLMENQGLIERER